MIGDRSLLRSPNDKKFLIVLLWFWSPLFAWFN